jgi:2-polyprenyl-3-methyl-5-hydroxy-6-metoxy-1,4-benzoquinol methylase
MLLIKSINGDIRLNDLERLRAEIGDRPDIRLVDGYYTAAEKDGLVALCDCYVSLHRSEGLGLTMAEAMAAGKPVIATGYSGNMHFMTPENSFPVDYALTRVAAGCQPYPEDAWWADPDSDHAAHLMRHVYEQPHEAAAKGQRARADMLQRHSAEVSAATIARRLDAIRRDRRSRTAVPAAVVATESSVVVGPAPVAVAGHVTSATATATDALHATLTRLESGAAPQILVDGRPFPKARSVAQRGLFRALRPFWFQHQQVHSELSGVLLQIARELKHEREARIATEQRLEQLATLESFGSGVASLRAESERIQGDLATRIEALAQTATDMGARVAALARAAAETGASVASLRTGTDSSFTNTAAHLDGLTRAVGMTEQSLSTLEQRLFAVPYMADPDRFLEQDDQGRQRLGYSSTNGTGDSAFYVGFEDVFRGPQTLIRDRQAVYVPMLRQASHVVDIGCGRGEMLDLLAAAHAPATGVDSDPDMVAMCRAKGHRVEQMDAVQFLRDREARSLPAIFSAQVIEHLPFEQLKAFLTLCRSRLQPGGTMIVETVNPHALEAFKTFYTDLTHQRPIFPEVALALVGLAGFTRAHVVFPLGTGTLTENRRTQGEYAVVATVDAEM